MNGRAVWQGAVLALGFGFLYLPIAVLVAYSFNGSRLVTIWGGFSTRWYGALIDDGKLLTAALTSLEIAVAAATTALVIGTCAGVTMNRFARFPGRSLLGFMLMAPLVVPEVILGLSLLLLFVGAQIVLGWPATRGVLTVTIAHATFASCFVAVLVRAQLAGFDRNLKRRHWTSAPGRSPSCGMSRCQVSARRWFPAGSWHLRCRSTIWWWPALFPGPRQRRCRWPSIPASASG